MNRGPDELVLRLGAGGAALSTEETAALAVAVAEVLAAEEHSPRTAASGWRRAARLEALGAPRVADLPDLRTRRPAS